MLFKSFQEFTMKKPFVAGNWKMNGLMADVVQLQHMQFALQAQPSVADVAVCLPTTLIVHGVASGLAIGGQDCHAQVSGAFTGDISAPMLADVGAKYVIVGHSERREYHQEADAQVAAKSNAAVAAGLHVIICVGESLAQREAGKAIEIVVQQLQGSIGDKVSASTVTIAYEPIWAIGTGKIPTLKDVVDMHAAIRAALVQRFGGEGEGVRIQYGGSVKPENAADLAALPNVDGFLVGGASLKADSFLPIVRAFG